MASFCGVFLLVHYYTSINSELLPGGTCGFLMKKFFTVNGCAIDKELCQIFKSDKILNSKNKHSPAKHDGKKSNARHDK